MDHLVDWRIEVFASGEWHTIYGHACNSPEEAQAYVDHCNSWHTKSPGVMPLVRFVPAVKAKSYMLLK